VRWIGDFPSAIIAPRRGCQLSDVISVYVFGRSFYNGASYDQTGVRYTQP
jgi:hypothetical protein